MEGLQGTVVPNGAGQPARGTGSPAQAAVVAYGGPSGDNSSQRLGPPKLGERRGLPRCEPVPKEGLRWLGVPNGPSPLAGGTGSPALAVVGAYGGLVGDGCSQRPGPTSWRDGVSRPGGGWCVWRVGGER